MSCTTALPERAATPNQVAKIFPFINPKTVRVWVQKGLITGYSVGQRKVVVDLDEIESKMVGRRQPSSEQPDIVAAIEKAIAQAPPITQAQRQRLAAILGANS